MQVLVFDDFKGKDWELEKETKVNSDFLLKKSSIFFILLPSCYLIYGS